MGKVACVTGASGFIAWWLVKLLLDRGYTVKATVRNLRDSSKTAHLMALDGAEERLQLFQANLIDEGSFDSAVDGCDGVFHTASPVIFDSVDDPQMELIEPAVKGTLNVLRSCAKVASVNRVVLTSSMATLVCKRNTISTDVVVDETWFSDPVFCEEAKLWYPLSKTLAEEAARKFAEENGINLLVINPGFVTGPLLHPTLNVTSIEFLNLITKGKSNGTLGPFFVFVDVRDVADAHVLAFENPSANGRCCLVAQVLYCSQVLDILRDLYPMMKLPESSKEEEDATMTSVQVSTEKAKFLGVNFISLWQSLRDTIQSLKERNLISFTM